MSTIDTDSAVGLEETTPDFIVVGGGTAGLVVANRLTEDPNVHVLVLEAGTNRLNDSRIMVPGLSPTTFEDPDFDWDFKSIPQEQLGGRRLVATRGRTLGGSSAINLGLVIWPSKSGMNAWERLGNPGWGWNGLAPYIRKFHTATAPSDKVRAFFKGMKYDQADQGSNGPVQVSFGVEYMPYHGAWFDTLKNLGYPQIEDPIKGGGKGPFVTPGAIDPVTHTRSHAGAAYLGESVRSRPNLRVVTGALVEKLVLEKKADSVVATGVRVSKGDRVYNIPVKREVILAAGTSKTPQILELSGIGDSALLRSHGIETVIDNKGVGENLQDHGLVSFGYEVADGLPSGDMARIPEVAAAAMAAYQKDGSGLLGMVPAVSALLPCLDFTLEERKKLVQRIEGPESQQISPALQKQYDELRRILDDPDEPTSLYVLFPFQVGASDSAKENFSLSRPGFFISILSLFCYPLSRGSVHLQSADPKAAPVIDHAIFRHPVDLELHARHCLWMQNIAETEPMASLLKKDGLRTHTSTPERITDLEQAKEICKKLVLSMYHILGTCAMLPREDGGVVDTRLKVYGTSNIRVVDASIMPLEPRGNIQATVFAVAEKAADIIKQDY